MGAKLLNPDEFSGKVGGSTSVDPAPDPVSLSSKATPSPELYVAAARMSEQSSRIAEAEELYQKAIRLDSRHADALVGYARLKDRQGRKAEAIRLYQRAAKAHPQNASVFNDLGLCLAKQRKFDQSQAALAQAINIAPKKWLYRNNMAMVLVETGKVDAAVGQLMAVQEEAVAHYNVAYILQKKGDSQAAARHFALALQKNPSLTEAQVWLARLGQQPASFASAAPRIASQRQPDPGFRATPTDARATDRSLAGPPRADLPAAPQAPALRRGSNPWTRLPIESRLPPIPDRTTVEPARPNAETSALGPASDRPTFSNVAPLPPPMSIGQPTQSSATNSGGTSGVSHLPPTPY